MKFEKYLPTLPQLTAETLAVIGATLIAAYVFSRFPAVQKFINDNSVTVRTP